MECIEHTLFMEIYWSLVSPAHFMTFTIFLFFKAHNCFEMSKKCYRYDERSIYSISLSSPGSRTPRWTPFRPFRSFASSSWGVWRSSGRCPSRRCHCCTATPSRSSWSAQSLDEQYFKTFFRRKWWLVKSQRRYKFGCLGFSQPGLLRQICWAHCLANFCQAIAR